MGYKTTIEDARHYLDLQRAHGRSVEEVQKHQRAFQLHVLKMQIAQEKQLSPDETVFLDRAIPDARAYYRFLGITEDRLLTQAMKNLRYKKVFILDPLPLVQDYARHEDGPAQREIQRLLLEVYSELPFPIVKVPILPPHERVRFVLDNL
jgi:predicted ATPase